jgi:hypothetical protein
VSSCVDGSENSKLKFPGIPAQKIAKMRPRAHMGNSGSSLREPLSHNFHRRPGPSLRAFRLSGERQRRESPPSRIYTFCFSHLRPRPRRPPSPLRHTTGCTLRTHTHPAARRAAPRPRCSAECHLSMSRTCLRNTRDHQDTCSSSGKLQRARLCRGRGHGRWRRRRSQSAGGTCR